MKPPPGMSGADRREPYRRDVAVDLMDADGRRFVAVEPSEAEAGGYRVAWGTVEGGALHPAGAPERFAADEVRQALQRVCALAGDWLGFTEWEIEEVRSLFVS